jgi:hypothetical protein
VKAKGAKKISFKEFQKALELISEKKNVAFDDLVTKITSSAGPVSKSTKADDVKFHDDKSLYTGL